jgi:hypothetical protein
MRELGLYVSTPAVGEGNRPALPRTRPVPRSTPDGDLHMVDISNAPFLRPDLEKLPSRIAYVLENDYPIRGTHTG